MNYEYLQTQLDRANVAFIWDEDVDAAWGRLRILPAIYYWGVTHFTLPKRWRKLSSTKQYDYLEYEYELLGNMDLGDEPLCSITSQNYESHTEYTIQPLLTRYQSHESPLVVAAESRYFDPKGGQRELQEQPFVEKLGSYGRVYNAFKEHYRDVGFGCPLKGTANLYLQDNANIYELVSGKQLSSKTELFNRLPELPYLPLYKVFIEIFGRDDGPGSSPLPTYAHIEGLSRWLRRRVEWDRQAGLEQAKRLNRAVDKDESIFAHKTRMRCTNEFDIGTVTRRIDKSKSDVHRRYWGWLQEVVR